jgi:hypothetical protein
MAFGQLEHVVVHSASLFGKATKAHRHRWARYPLARGRQTEIASSLQSTAAPPLPAKTSDVALRGGLARVWHGLTQGSAQKQDAAAVGHPLIPHALTGTTMHENRMPRGSRQGESPSETARGVRRSAGYFHTIRPSAAARLQALTPRLEASAPAMLGAGGQASSASSLSSVWVWRSNPADRRKRTRSS